MNFSVVTFGTKQAQRMIEGVGERAANARPALEEIYLTILDINQEAFEKEGERDGFPKWHQLSLRRIKEKARKSIDPRILHGRTGRLEASVTEYRSPDAYTRIEKDKIVMKSTLPYAEVLFKGNRSYRGGKGYGIPPRPYIRFSERDANAFAKEISRFVARGV